MGIIRSRRRVLATDRARNLRRRQTDAEARLWNALRDRGLGGWKWRRQVSFGAYYLDFLCDEARLVVELDGGQHAEQVAYDARRTDYLRSRGLRVLRFWNSTILENRAGACDMILDACGGEHPDFAAMSLGHLSPERSDGGRG